MLSGLPLTLTMRTFTDCYFILEKSIFYPQVRIQTMPPPEAGQKPLYTSTLDCARKIFMKEVLFYGASNKDQFANII